MVPQALAAWPLQAIGTRGRAAGSSCDVSHCGPRDVTGNRLASSTASLKVQPAVVWLGIQTGLPSQQARSSRTFMRVLQSTPCQPAGQRHQPVDASHTPAGCRGSAKGMAH